MSRYIDVDKLLKDIEKYHLSDGKFQHWVEIQPTADVVPRERYDKVMDNLKAVLEESDVHGEWVKDNKDIYGYRKICSICGKHFPWVTPFCPNCGADMQHESK